METHVIDGIEYKKVMDDPNIPNCIPLKCIRCAFKYIEDNGKINCGVPEDPEFQGCYCCHFHWETNN